MKISRDKITLGTDPEVFLVNSLNEAPISSIGKIGGTKDFPKKLSDMGHFVQEDNVLVEFNTPPCIDAESLDREIRTALSLVEEILPDNTKLLIESSMEFPLEELKDPMARRFGCDPDYNAWTYCTNDPPSPNATLRTAGGHIHIGYAEIDESNTVSLIRALDLFLGVASIIMDTDKQRRKLYGKAGSFRFKEYGLEYRTLSNFWIANKELVNWAVNGVFKAIDFINNDGVISEELGHKIQECINTSNETLANEIIKQFDLEVIKQPEKIRV